MERLTVRDFEYDFCAECQFSGEPNGCNKSTGTCEAYDFCGEAWDKLAAYEDTDLTPEQITVLQSEVERLRAVLEAAKADLKHSDNCDICAHASSNPDCNCECDECELGCPCNECMDESNWQWRGLQEVSGE